MYSVVLVLMVASVVVSATLLEPKGAAGGSMTMQVLNSDSMWTLRNGNGTEPLGVPSIVPGDCFGDLMRDNILGDPFYRFNDENYRWVPYTNWTWSRPVSLTQNNVELVELVFEGIQGVADVTINGTFVGRMVDSFRRYVFNVTDFVLPAGTFALTVHFQSSVDYATDQYNRYNTTTPKPDAPAYLTGLPHRNFIRTEQSSFGWDWSPAFAPQGIYRDVYLRLYSSKSVASTIDFVVPHVLPLPLNKSISTSLLDPVAAAKQEFMIDTRVYVRIAGSSAAFLASVPQARVTITAPTLMSIHGTNAKNSSTVAFASCKQVDDSELYEFRVELYVKNSSLWWPHTYGPQHLHRLDVSVQLLDVSGNDIPASQGGLLTDSVRTGIRAIELVTYGDPLKFDPVPEDHVGDRPAMFFKINGIPLFAKGANLVPFDAFQFRVNSSVMKNILVSAKEANMNMIRVWGGGLFPLQSFYDMADEMGILLWQEMIFACAEYPINADFLFNVRREISHQLKRLGRHPSISIWSGNNENGVYDKGPGSPYEILDYDNVLYEIFRQDASRPVWPTSPSTGFAYGTNKQTGLPSGTMDHPLPFKVGGDSGDTHFYNYFTCPNVSVYPRTNFASEFGFQSLPWFENIEHETKPEDWSLFSKWMNHRQHHPDGNKEIEALLKQNFKVDNIDFNSTALSVFRRVIYLTQLQQTLCIANEAEFYRRGRNEPYRTMGTLYWQLNQNWQAPSWTSIEYGGDWKVLHYRMMEVYSEFHVSGYINTTTKRIVAHIASDALLATTALLQVYVVPYDATHASLPHGLDSASLLLSQNEKVPALGGLFFFNVSYDSIAKNATLCPLGPSSCFLYFEILRGDNAGPFESIKRSLESSTERRNVRLAEPSTLWLTTVKEAGLINNVQVSVRVLAISISEALLEVSTNATALYVMLRVRNNPLMPNGRFSKNSFALLPNVNELVTFRKVVPPNGDTATQPPLPSARELEANIFVDTLNDMW